MDQLESDRNVDSLTVQGSPAIDRRPRHTRCLSNGKRWLVLFGGRRVSVWSDRLTVRAGAGYEISPSTTKFVRHSYQTITECGPRLARAWRLFKVYPVRSRISHIWVHDPSINITAVSGNPSFIDPLYLHRHRAMRTCDVLSLAMVFTLGCARAGAGRASRSSRNKPAGAGRGARAGRRRRPLHFQNAPVKLPPSISKFCPVI